MQFSVIPMDEAMKTFGSLISGGSRCVLFGGDRGSCCDEAVVLKNGGGEFLGLASIAPEGEGTGTPTIVGLFVVPQERGRGNGTALMRAALERCRQRGFPRVRVDILSLGAKKIIERLTEYRQMLEVVDNSDELMSSLLY